MNVYEFILILSSIIVGLGGSYPLTMCSFPAPLLGF